VVLHYWPRVDSMRGCAAATLNDTLQGDSMCSNEAEDLLYYAGSERQQLPIRCGMCLFVCFCVAKVCGRHLFGWQQWQNLRVQRHYHDAADVLQFLTHMLSLLRCLRACCGSDHTAWCFC
jgi:hypothetical protein